MSVLHDVFVGDKENNVIYTTSESLLSTSMLTIVENVTDVIYGSTNIIHNVNNVNNFINNESDGTNPFSFDNNNNVTFEHKEYIFDRKEVRYVFITLYSLVFCFCFFGE
jgi:hypothetical protein